jgi:hypothetical protein
LAKDDINVVAHATEPGTPARVGITLRRAIRRKQRNLVRVPLGDRGGRPVIAVTDQYARCLFSQRRDDREFMDDETASTSRAFIRHWLKDEQPPNQAIRQVSVVADRILRAGRAVIATGQGIDTPFDTKQGGRDRHVAA